MNKNDTIKKRRGLASASLSEFRKKAVQDLFSFSTRLPCCVALLATQEPCRIFSAVCPPVGKLFWKFAPTVGTSVFSHLNHPLSVKVLGYYPIFNYIPDFFHECLRTKFNNFNIKVFTKNLVKWGKNDLCVNEENSEPKIALNLCFLRGLTLM